MLKSDLDSLKSVDFERFVIYREPGKHMVHLLVLDEESLFLPENYFAVRGFSDDAEHCYPILNEYSFDQTEIMLESIVFPSFVFSEVHKHGVSNQSQFVEMVETAIMQIDNGELEKVVLARCLFEDVQVKNLFKLFKHLCSNTEVFAYVFHNQNGATWAGASPELLLSKSGNKVSSMALAGTRLNSSNKVWAKKEIQEQRIVSDYIQSTFIANQLSHVQNSSSFTLSTGKLQHICSEVVGEHNSQSNIRNLIEALHPTPALGGFPRQKALQFIQTNEHFDRELYGGYLGRVQSTRMDLYVNIRCVRIGQNGVKYFAGAGINHGSNAEKEWLETENKLSVMRALIASLKVESQP